MKDVFLAEHQQEPDLMELGAPSLTAGWWSSMTHLLRSQVPLLLGQQLIAHHELLDGGGAQQRRVVVSVQLPVGVILLQKRSGRSS